MSENVTIKEKDLNKAKSAEQIERENQGLMSAFSEQKEERKVDMDKLEALKAKLNKKAQKEEEVVPTLVSKREVSINMGIIGVGQAGSRIAEEFHKLGYDTAVINTSAQDLEYIKMLPNQKLLLEGTLGGTGKSLDLGREIFSLHREEIKEFLEQVVDGNDMMFLAVSGGGGTGSSSPDTMIEILSEFEMPIGVIFVLPKQTEDAQSKANAVETLARLAKMTSDNLITTLIIVDNAQIEQIYGGLSQSQFWSAANRAIVEPIDLFNRLTSQPSAYTSLDPSDFSRIISCGDCSVFGVMEVDNFVEETALAEAVINSLKGNLLAEGFDLTQTRTAGVIIVGSKESLEKLPAINIDYCFSMLSETINGGNIFQGIYVQDDVGDKIKIFSWFAGLGLPQGRVENLKKESKASASILTEKEKGRATAMSIGLEENKVLSVKEEIERKIKAKNSGFNKLQGGARQSIIDKRKR